MIEHHASLFHPKAVLDELHKPRQPLLCQFGPEKRLGRIIGQNLRLTDIIGTGAYGTVYAAVNIETGYYYAVKCVHTYNPDGSTLSCRQTLRRQREINLHRMVSAHPNVVPVLKVLEDYDCVYIVMEYCPGGDLFYCISTLGKYIGDDELCKKIFIQLLDAVEYCHNLGVYHRDLKPENILVTDHCTVKLADFGLATSESFSTDFGCGSSSYMSPECMAPTSKKPYYMCAPNDIWSLGVILVNLICGRNPWERASENDCTYRAFARSQDLLKKILPLTDELNNILKQIFEPNPELRITISELRRQILACRKFTAAPTVKWGPLTPPSTPPTETCGEQDAATDGSSVDARSSVKHNENLEGDNCRVDECYPQANTEQRGEDSASNHTKLEEPPAVTSFISKNPRRISQQSRKHRKHMTRLQTINKQGHERKLHYPRFRAAIGG